MRSKVIVIGFLLIFCLFFFLWWFLSYDLIRPEIIESKNYVYSMNEEMPSPRTESGGLAFQDKLYVFGGINFYGGTLQSAYLFNTKTRKWVRIKDIPEPINHVGVVHDQKYIYLIGGFKPLSLRVRGFMFANWNPLNTLYRYNVSLDKWDQLSNMPEPRGAGGACIINDTIWYVGGINQHKNISNTLFGYSIKENNWFKSVPMHFARDHFRAEAVNGKIYAISGRKDDLRFNVPYVEEFNRITKTWKRMADFPSPRGGFGSSVHNGKIYTYGGENVWSTSSSVEVYDPALNKWEKSDSLPESRHGIVSGWIDSELHLVTGGRHPRISVSGIHRVLKLKRNTK